MNPLPKTGRDHQLAKGITVEDYERLKAQRDCRGIADLIRKRFGERYLNPINNTPLDNKSGFCMVAIGCLMIEALECFHQGWATSNKRSKAAFCEFFNREQPFQLLKRHSEAFYEHVRCGILHQAETTGGWRIRRDNDGLLFDEATRTLNANAFLNALSESLESYCTRLAAAGLDDTQWKNATAKLDSICDHCSA